MTYRNSRFAPATLVATLALLVVAACGPRTVDETVQPAPGADVVTAAEITGIMTTLNTGEVEMAQLALERSRNTAVREFAQRMINEHTHNDQQLESLSTQLNIQRRDNNLTRQLSTNAMETMEVLRDMRGTEFDRTYIDHQVQMHQWALRALDNTLIPSAEVQSGRLHTYLIDTRQSVADHLSQAQNIQRSLGG